jgi:cytochrome b involved in lipid metabolism
MCRADLSRAELHVLHQLCLPSMGDYSRSNSSRDSWWVSLITLGEGYHNYHHTFPRDYRNGSLWYNVDPSKWLLYMLPKLGLAEGLVRCDSGVSSFQRLFPDNMKPETRNQQLDSRTTLHSQGRL